MTVIFNLVVGAALLGLGVLVLDVALRGVLRWGARHLPNELAGPEGWFVDTTGHAGVYDRRG